MTYTFRAEIILIVEAIRENLEGDNYYSCEVKFLEGTLINKNYFARIILENNKNYFNVGDNVICKLIVLEKDGKKEPIFYIRLKDQTNFNEKNEKLYYITNANLKRILYRIEKSDFNYESEIWKIKIDFLNKLEKKDILAYKYFFEFQDDFLEYYNKINTREDKYVYINSSAFHDDNTCERLLSHFDNFQIPESIRTKKEHDLYRKWFTENLRLLEKNRPELDDLFKQNHYVRWGCYPIKVDYNNSGAFKYENLTMAELEILIDDTLDEAKAFINSSKVNLEILSTIGKVSAFYNDLSKIKNREAINYDDATISLVLQYFELKIKRPLKNHLKEYYRIKNNPNLMFTANLLSELGLKYCSSCNGKHIVKLIPEETLLF